MVQRKGNVKALRTDRVDSATIIPIIKKNVMPNSTVYTDEFRTYNSLKKNGYDHKRVNHGDEVWVIGDAHTNTIEGFWSLVKRGINGVYHSVDGKYLQSYVNEYTFRYNRRGDEKPMFWSFF